MTEYNPKKPPLKETRQKKQKSIVTAPIILTFVAIIAIAIATFMYIDTQNLKKQYSQNQLKLEQIQKENEKKWEEEQSRYYEEKTKALEIEYALNIDNQIYVKEKNREKLFKYNDTLEIKDKIKKENEVIIVEKEVVKKDYNLTNTDFIYVEKDILKKQKENEVIIVEKEIKEIKKDIPQKKIDYKLPMLAIIIDDVTTQKQVNKIKDIGYIVNMAFLPPTNHHKNSAKITNKLDNFMIHLPLEASTHNYEEDNTLYIHHDIDVIDKRIKELKKLYPKAKFINNHTGSKYTSNKKAMNKLLKVLKKYNYTFIDSKTTSNSVVIESAKKYGLRVLSRNIFLDNKRDKHYIQKQLRRAVVLAKKNGSAIAIGHPHGVTLSTLKQSKYILKDVNLVFVNAL